MARNYSLRCFRSNRSSMNHGVADKGQTRVPDVILTPPSRKHRARMGHPQFGSPRQNPQRERGRATQPVDLGLLAYDAYEGYKLGIAYGWWKPSLHPQANSSCKKKSPD